jgi:hypothetical protein
VIAVPDPAASGTQEELSITGLNPETLYYFALKVADSTGNVSDISNVVLPGDIGNTHALGRRSVGKIS